MAYNYTTSRADLDKSWKQVEADVRKGFGFGTDEIALLQRLESESTPWSANSVTFPIDLNPGYGAASIEEFGFEPNPSTPDLEEATEDVIHMVGRFNLSKLTKHTDKGQTNQRERVLARSAMKKAEAIRSQLGDYFYGFNDAVVAITDTDVTGTSATLVIKDGYGRTDITAGAFLVNKFPIGEGVALMASGSDALIHANAIGVVTAVNPSTPSITVSFIGSVASFTANGIRIVKANAATAATLDQTITGTDLGKGLVGLLQMVTSASLHGLTHSRWLAAYQDATGGRFNAQRFRRMKDEIADKAPNGGTLDLLIMDRGVYRDTTALQSAALRFSDPTSLSIDGDIAARGVQIFQSKRVPTGYVFGLHKGSVCKWMPGSTTIPGENQSASWSDGKEYIDRSGFVYTLEVVAQMVCHARAGLSMLSGLDTQ